MPSLLETLEPVTVNPRVLQVLGLSLGKGLIKPTGGEIGPLQLVEGARELTLLIVLKR